MSGWRTAKRVRGFIPAFDRYLQWLVRRSFSTVWLSKSSAALPPDGYIAAANHSSWWDGFIPELLHRSAGAERDIALMMSDAELRRFPFFRWGGAFSVDVTSIRRAREAIVYAASEARRGAGVWIFPQGQMDAGNQWTPFTCGFVHAARMSGRPIVPVALRYAMRASQRPEAFVEIGEALPASARSTADTEQTIKKMLCSIDESIRANSVDARHVPFMSSHAGIDERVGALLARFR